MYIIHKKQCVCFVGLIINHRLLTIQDAVRQYFIQWHREGGDRGPDALYSVGTLANKLYIFSTGGKRKSS